MTGPLPRVVILSGVLAVRSIWPVLLSDAVGAWQEARTRPAQPSSAALPSRMNRGLLPLEKPAQGKALLLAAMACQARPVTKNLMIVETYASIR